MLLSAVSCSVSLMNSIVLPNRLSSASSSLFRQRFRVRPPSSPPSEFSLSIGNIFYPCGHDSPQIGPSAPSGASSEFIQPLGRALESGNRDLRVCDRKIPSL